SIAHSWEIMDSGKAYRFNLRDDVYFHDNVYFENGEGRRVIAQDVKYSLNRVIDEELSSPGSWIFSQVNRKADGSLDIEIIDDQTLIIHLKQAFPPFLGILSMQYCSIVPQEVV